MILLTGGSGFVGLNVAEQLLARGEELVIFDLRAPPPFFSKARFVQGDVSDFQTVQKIFADHSPSEVIHMSAITAGPERDAREPLRIAEVNLIGTLNVPGASLKTSAGRRASTFPPRPKTSSLGCSARIEAFTIDRSLLCTLY
jgi:nucleoside-diphosphate-sugar epimerase